MQDRLDALTRSLAGSFAFTGLAVAQGDTQTFSTATAPGMVADEHTMFRVASISKVVLGHVMHTVMEQCDIADYTTVKRGVRDRVVDLAMLVSHSAGLADMIVPTDRSLTSFLAHNNVRIGEPGAQFAYSNLGYVIAAAIFEDMTHKPYDQLAAEVLDHLNIPGGFNWSGVPAIDRASALATYRKDGTHFIAQVDKTVPPKGLIAADGSVIDVSNYEPGWNPSVFAPHGGLRTNLKGMLTLAQSLKHVSQQPLWRQTDGPGDYLDGLFQDYGLGVQILPDPPFYPRPLIGHFGNAYGFRGGVWHDAQADLSFAYALNGAAMGDESDLLSPAELQVFDALAAVP